uniref:Armadillo repeat containing X-linked 6 n=1 Tax=Oryctolagus cuniculus TaxID=9986 RepID=A0A5F9CQH7_RABIT|nr:protein ARMCX6 [Oryctolagus cuniculus]XP_008271298.1 protein ARMCX6 [Oryctolagus cuniculus]XP_008271299.1 protein ARMCX6 [Oryctolagus cuniculus]XP_008271300.1 protein ARMCX6 [Oryctolagus cuniculus]XP_008271301.1 protein ARMCX6 [Oryctolagus cuniculus]XP_051683417.1 protein ARMCX6 [Oryctolagus cuniculus]XP_051683419.1 protein ARMCX6 [Oryctolagus cuniculus]
MGRAREVGWMAAGLMIGAGACYCVYKLTIGRNESDNSEEEEEEEWDDDQDPDEEEPEIWFDFTTMARPWSEDGEWTEPGAPGGTEDRPSGGGKASRAHPTKQRPFPYEHKNTWSAQSCKHVSCSLRHYTCPFIQGLTERQDAGFALSHGINSHLASLSRAGNLIPTPQRTFREQALCALGSSHASIQSQGQIKTSITEVYRETVSRCCGAFLQQAGFSLLISVAVINDMLAKSITDLQFPLIPEGSGRAEVQASKLWMGLSEKPALAGEWLGFYMLFPFMAFLARSANPGLLLHTPAY